MCNKIQSMTDGDIIHIHIFSYCVITESAIHQYLELHFFFFNFSLFGMAMLYRQGILVSLLSECCGYPSFLLLLCLGK